MSKDEKVLIMKIAERADGMGLLMFDRLSLIMDIEVAHAEVGLRLDDFLNADDENFAHDVVGIQKHIDRHEKKLTDLFLPRYAKGGM